MPPYAYYGFDVASFLNNEMFRQAYQRAREHTVKNCQGPVTGPIVSQSAIKAQATVGGTIVFTDVDFKEVV